LVENNRFFANRQQQSNQHGETNMSAEDTKPTVVIADRRSTPAATIQKIPEGVKGASAANLPHNLDKMTRDEFREWLAKHKPSRMASGNAPKVGDKFMIMTGKTPIAAEVVRVEAGAKSCCFLMDANGAIFYRNFLPERGQLKPIAEH
jgi:hypothetical protein